VSDNLRMEVTEVAEFTAMQWGLNLQAAYERIAELVNVEEAYEDSERRYDELYEEKEELEKELEKAEESHDKLCRLGHDFHAVVENIVTPDVWDKIKEAFDYEGYYDYI
jgi:predicted nuclease with TOPRIM domain